MIINFLIILLDKYESTRIIMLPVNTGGEGFFPNNLKCDKFSSFGKYKISFGWDFVEFIVREIKGSICFFWVIFRDSYFLQLKLNPCQI